MLRFPALPLGIAPADNSPVANSTRYHLLTAMMTLTGGKGFRTAGTKRGVTKRPYSTRSQRIATAMMGQ